VALRGSEKVPASLLSLQDIGMAVEEIERRAKMYDVVEMATSVKAQAMCFLLEDFETVTYFDPDVYLYADPSSKLANEHNPLVLTPHRLSAAPIDDLYPSEIDIRKFGIFNLGFISAHRLSYPFLKWWDERLSIWSANSPFEGYFTDQSWMDFAPALAELTVEKSKGMNIAPWNLDERGIRVENSVLMAEMDRLIFIHFSSVGSNLRSPSQILNAEFKFHRSSALLESKMLFRKLSEEWWAVVVTWSSIFPLNVPYRLGHLNSTKRVPSKMERDIFGSAVRRAAKSGNLESHGSFRSVPFSNLKIFERAYGLSTVRAVIAGVRSDLKRVQARKIKLQRKRNYEE